MKNRIIQAVISETGITKQEIEGKDRHEDIINARHIYWYLRFKKGEMKYHIAKDCKVNNATIHSAINKIYRYIQGNDPKTIVTLAKINDYLKTI